MHTTIQNFQMDDVLLRALNEDINSEDFTTNAIFEHQQQACVSLIAKEDGKIAGLDVFKRVFTLYDPEVTFKEVSSLKDGDWFKKGDIILDVVGNIRSLLSCERVALNFIQRMSGIATLTAAYIKALDDPNIKVFDTRKTTPNLRIFEKYAVRVGGGYNHRFNLSDGILLKDNHIEASGGVREAILKAKAYTPFVKHVEIEVESLEDLKKALDAKADIIMLDNMDLDMTKEAILITDKQAIIEVSGNISLETIGRYKGLDIDYISSGSLTNNPKIIDFSMKHLRYIK